MAVEPGEVEIARMPRGGSRPGGSLRVMKFGGTSVAGAERLRRIADLVAAALSEERAVVVVSAVSGVTNLLLEACDRALAGEEDGALARFREVHAAIVRDLAGELGAAGSAALAERLACLEKELARSLSGIALLADCSPRVRAQVAALGERASVELLAALLSARGLPPERLDPRQVLPCEGDPLEAVPLVEEAKKRLAPFALGAAPLAVVPGFFGGDGRGDAVLLGRGGSDYSAALFAQALGARLLEIWTDVAGIYTADPRMVPAARPVAEVSFEEAMELAHFGAKVLHPKSVAPARAAGIPVRICNTFAPEDPGTMVRPSGAPLDRIACGLSLLREVALLSIAGPGMKGVPGVAARAFGALAERGLSVMLITQGSSECVISLGLRTAEAERAVAALAEAFSAEIAAGRVEEIEAQSDLAILSLVGDGMRHRTGVAGGLFGALGAAAVNVVAIAQGGSERSICVVIDDKDGEAAMRSVHARFFESAPSPTLVSPRPGGEAWGGGSARDRAAAVPPFHPGPSLSLGTTGASASPPLSAGELSEARREVAVFAPAGIGNLAAGFDVLGAAIEPLDGAAWGDTVEVRGGARDELLCVGEFASRLPADCRKNLVWRARDAVERALGAPLPPLALTLRKNLPVASGLGGSAASAVAAVLAIDLFLGSPLSAAQRLHAAAEAEAGTAGAAHLDNVAAILLGGVRLVVCGEKVRELPWPAALRFVLVVPELELATRRARAVLPREVPLALAVAHAQNLAALVHALHADDRELLAATLRDLLAEPHRAALVPGFAAAKAAALAAGALGCSLSGAGPSLFAVADDGIAAAVGEAAARAWRAAGVACSVRICRASAGPRRVAVESGKGS